MATFIDNTLALFLDAAPWLLVGLLAAGLIKGYIPEVVIRRWLAGRGAGAVFRAAIVGAPLPLCSCGVLPTALALRRGGASRGATVSFLVATPETGVDSVAVSYALLGPLWALWRPFAAIASAIATGLLTERVAGRERQSPPPFRVEAAAAGCGCNGSCGSAPPKRPPHRLLQALAYTVDDIVPDIMPWLLGGLLLAGAIVTAVPPMALAEWGGGLPAMLGMLLIGIPIYVCATASTPMAAALLAAGLSPGTVLVFLLAGPATNLASLGVIRQALGTTATVAYLTGIAASALALGLTTDALLAPWLAAPPLANGAEELLPHWLAVTSGILLLAGWGAALWRRRLARRQACA